MLLNILKLKGSQVLSKDSQKSISGGFLDLRGGPSGCFSSFFFCTNGEYTCAVLGASGELYHGTHSNDQCCL